MFFQDHAREGFYFIGIGGVSMSALARLLRERGYLVRGSDMQEGTFTRLLRQHGIDVHIGETEVIREGIVVYTGAIAENNPQLMQARRDGKLCLTRPKLLGKIADEFPHVVSVAGCHGKTSTTSMLAHIFLESGRPFTCHIGGEDLLLGNFYSTGGEYFLTEACEFQRSFLSIQSEIAIILNTDLDHTDCYQDADELFEAYREFSKLAKKLVVNADDVRGRTLPHELSFGLYGGDIRAEKIRSVGEKYSFTVSEKGVPIIRIKLGCVGKVLIYDALAAYAAARLMGFSAEEIRRGLEKYSGVGRRFEYVGTLNQVPVVCDYAHHPREIAAVLETAKNICTGTVRLVFQPHTYTRTRDFLTEFADVLKKAENPIIYKTYAAREDFDARGSALALLSYLPDGIYVQTPKQLKKRLLDEIKKDDLILVLGAGDIFQITQQILD